MPKVFGTALLLCLVMASPAAAENLRGARALLDMVTKYSSMENETPESSLSKWKDQLIAYRKNPPAVAQDAVQQWLALYDGLWSALPSSEGQYLDELKELRNLMAALPGPDTWPDLRKASAERQTKGTIEGSVLNYITAVLMQDRKGAGDALEQLETFGRQLPKWKQSAAHQFYKNIQRILISADDTAKPQITHFLNGLRAPADDRAFHEVEVPDLVTIVGTEEAQNMLRQAMTTDRVLIKVPVGDETRKLAVKTALETIDDMREPQWLLCMGIGADNLKLYEALEKEFGQLPSEYMAGREQERSDDSPQENEGTYSGGNLLAQWIGLGTDPDSELEPPEGSLLYYQAKARPYYMVSLILQGRSDEAKDVAFDMGFHRDSILSTDVVQFIQRSGQSAKLAAFLREVLQEKPELALWETYIAVAASSWMKAEPEALISAILQNQRLGKLNRLKFQIHLFKLYLAFDEIERAQATLDGLDLTPSTQPMWDSSRHQEYILDLGSTLIGAGRLLPKKDWIEQGLSLIKKLPEQASALDYVGEGARQRLLRELVALDRFAQAETILLEHMEKLLRQMNNPDVLAANQMARWQLSLYLPDLIKVYHKSGRYADIIRLTEGYPYWEYEGLLRALDNYYADKEFGFIIANALFKIGRADEATKVLKHLIVRYADYDPLYELLCKINGPQIIPWLDRVYALDQFEERPLIWKADLLAGANRLDEALAVAQQAIAIDPSDGEQGHGRRMRAYAVLAKIYQVRGNEEQSQFYQRVVAAIRKSEDADDLYDAGLIKRAVDQYEEALTVFSDAYCIQSRAAVYQESLGNAEAAEKHYRKAYALMPASFGRLESHCFGCEEVFSTDQRRKIAEEVFLSLRETMPENPQVHYLLGYLRKEEGHPEAK
ncbi:MAG: hypothetical protein K8I00_07205, partial [Candidatus Omnitrophica bacterium]|nr:hypothetical protein [Candidatus Omnitrophota bacterium]